MEEGTVPLAPNSDIRVDSIFPFEVRRSQVIVCEVKELNSSAIQGNLRQCSDDVTKLGQNNLLRWGISKKICKAIVLCLNELLLFNCV